MTLASLPVEQLLQLRFPSYHRPLDLARQLARSSDEGERTRAIALLDGLRGRYPHVLAIGQELVLALMQGQEPGGPDEALHDRAERVLLELEARFLTLDEETLCRWGRLFKDRGDLHVRLPWSRPEDLAPDPDLAAGFYRRAFEKYERAYRIRSGHYPGINAATLLLMIGALRPASPDGPPPELRRSADLAGKLLADRPRWPAEQADDPTLWHPATAGEAFLLRREWDRAAEQYGQALRCRRLTGHARVAMRRQVERIAMCFRKMDLAVSPPFDDPDAFFGAEPARPDAGADVPSPAEGPATSESSPDPSV